MLSKKIEEALNAQINAELYSSYLYLSMSAYFKSINLDGFANWMYVQAQEELAHAIKFYNFINQKGGRIILSAVEAPPTNWISPLDAFEKTLEHEIKVTSLINNLLDIAISEKDHSTSIFLQWFITEQVEEESNAENIIKQLKLTGDSNISLFLIDRELAKRLFINPLNTQST